MLNSWFDDGDIGPFYCPDCGIIEGFLAYNPDIREQFYLPRNILFHFLLMRYGDKEWVGVNKIIER